MVLQGFWNLPSSGSSITPEKGRPGSGYITSGLIALARTQFLWSYLAVWEVGDCSLGSALEEKEVGNDEYVAMAFFFFFSENLLNVTMIRYISYTLHKLHACCHFILTSSLVYRGGT